MDDYLELTPEEAAEKFTREYNQIIAGRRFHGCNNPAEEATTHLIHVIKRQRLAERAKTQ